MIIRLSSKACLTTGTPTVSSRAAILIHELLVLACTAGFAAYDLHTRTVPRPALLLFTPIAALAPFLQALAGPGIQTVSHRISGAPASSAGIFLSAFLPALLASLAGAAAGFLILLTASLISAGGTGVGGGDIKLAAVLGFCYGVSRMLFVLLTASALALAASFITARKNKRKMQGNLSLPFVPFLAAGSLAAFLVTVL